jgi:hypothetical protein
MVFRDFGVVCHHHHVTKQAIAMMVECAMHHTMHSLVGLGGHQAVVQQAARLPSWRVVAAVEAALLAALGGLPPSS